VPRGQCEGSRLRLHTLCSLTADKIMPFFGREALLWATPVGYCVMDLIPITKPNSFAISGISYPSLTRLSCLTFHDRRLTVGLSSMIPTSVSVRNAAAKSAAMTRGKPRCANWKPANYPFRRRIAVSGTLHVLRQYLPATAGETVGMQS